jgi:hypothetical protein
MKRFALSSKWNLSSRAPRFRQKLAVPRPSRTSHTPETHFLIHRRFPGKKFPKKSARIHPEPRLRW